MRTDMLWIEDEVARLQRYIDEGLTGGQIALLMGCSRSAIAGKMDRLGLKTKTGIGDGKQKHRQLQFRKRDRPKTEPKPSPQRKATFAFRPHAPTLAPLPEKRADDVARCGIFDLTSNTCRWPVGNPGEPGFGFCGDRPLPGVPYCSMHAARAFT